MIDEVIPLPTFKAPDLVVCPTNVLRTFFIAFTVIYSVLLESFLVLRLSMVEVTQ